MHKNIILILFIVFHVSLAFSQTYMRPPAMIEGLTAVTKAAGTTTLTSASQTQQVFTGASTQTVVMPDATTLDIGRKFYVVNSGSAGTVTVQANGGGAITTVIATTAKVILLQAKGSAAGTWVVEGNLPASAITGVLPIANGGTNASSFTDTQITFFNGTSLVGDADLAWIVGTNTLNATNVSATTVVGSTSVTSATLAATTALTLEEPGAGTDVITVDAPATVTAYTLTLPDAVPAVNSSPLVMDTSGEVTFGAALPTSCTAGGIAYGTGTALACTAQGTSGRAVLSGAAGAPTFFNATQDNVITGTAAGALQSAPGITAASGTLTAPNIVSSGGAAASRMLVLTAHNSQSADIMQVNLNAATVFSLGPSGNVVVDGSADVNQLRVQANGTQTSDLFVLETSGGTDLFTVENAGGVVVGAGAATAGSILDIQSTTLGIGLPDIATASLPTCNGTSEGTFAWDTTLNAITVCDGTAWRPKYSGTYTPTCTAVTNVASITVRAGRFSTDGIIVETTIMVETTNTAASDTSTEFTCTLPVASNLTNYYDLGGVVSTNLGTPFRGGEIEGSTGADRARVFYSAASTGSTVVIAKFNYEVK